MGLMSSMTTSAKDRIRSLLAEILETQDSVRVQVIGAKLQAAIRELADELRLKSASPSESQNWQSGPSL
jgi:hypothetical protein